MRIIDSSILQKYVDNMKYCKKCDTKLPLENFNIRMCQGKYRPFSYCKDCERKKDRERYNHICSKCGLKYKSGKKNSSFCKKCYCETVGKMGKLHLKKLNRCGENNPMYGVQRFGKNNPNFKKHKTDEEREIGRLIEGYGIWRDSVYKRDNYICQCCGYDKGGTLVAHHLNGYSWCKEGRTDIENGITLCKTCHKQFHAIYTYFHNTKEQFEEFLNNKLIKSS
ncbi:HNH endonuclease [Lactobacillus hominis]|uniref:HNH endonuclease n=1 Tax=Lactobacillus hominis TaxID=1203033 RepID=UPI00263BACEF|nr:HNH endonuclease [Lactobacillus hominis]